MNILIAILVFLAGASSGFWLPLMIGAGTGTVILSIILGAAGGWGAATIAFN